MAESVMICESIQNDEISMDDTLFQTFWDHWSPERHFLISKKYFNYCKKNLLEIT